jgi:enamine deaminase RidA (YjgF/YER057c/UK114 family)
MLHIQRTDCTTRLSDMVVYNGIAWLAGQVPDDTRENIEGQTRQVLAMVDRLLARVGSDRTRILMVQIFLADLADYAGMNKVWDSWVPAGHAPARATVQAELAKADWKIEVVVMAAVPVAPGA